MSKPSASELLSVSAAPPLQFKPLTLDARQRETRTVGTPQQEPLALEAEFVRVVLAAVDRLGLAVTKAVRGITSDAKDDDLRGPNPFVPADVVHDLVRKVDAYNTRQVKRSIGLTAPGMTTKRLKAIAQRTLANVRGIQTAISERLTVTVAKAAKQGLRGTAIEETIARSLKVEREKARRIAVGQVIQINATLTRERHAKLGVTEYIWRSIPDAHTRPWHRKLNGQKCRYDSPPLGGGGGPKDHGHPGSSDRCRCQALPVIPKAIAPRPTRDIPINQLKPSDIVHRVNELGGAGGAKTSDAGVFQNKERTQAVLAAFRGVSSDVATLIATGQAEVAASTEYSRAVARGNKKLPPIELYVLEPIKGAAELKLADGRHRLKAAKQSGATAIRANIVYERETRSGRWVSRTMHEQVVKI